MQFQVPQFIDAEDKIVGPLTLRQFLTLGAGIGVSTLLFFILSLWLWLILSLLIVGLAAAFALVKVNGRPFWRVAAAALHFYWTPQTYVWLPEQPDLPKNEENAQKFGGFSLEKFVRGLALKSALQEVQTGTHNGAAKAGIELRRRKEKYEIFRGLTGERRIAKRIDYH